MAKGGAMGVSPAMLQAILGSAPGGFPAGGLGGSLAQALLNKGQGGMGAAMNGAAQQAAGQYRMFTPGPMPNIPYMPQAQVGPQAIPIGQPPQPAQPAIPSQPAAPGSSAWLPRSPQGYFNAPGVAGPRPVQSPLANAFGAGGLMAGGLPRYGEGQRPSFYSGLFG